MSDTTVTTSELSLLEDSISATVRRRLYTVSQFGGIGVMALFAGIGYYTANGGAFSLGWTAIGVGLLAGWQGFQTLASTLAKSFVPTSGATLPVATDEGAEDGDAAEAGDGSEDNVDNSDSNAVTTTDIEAAPATQAV